MNVYKQTQIENKEPDFRGLLRRRFIWRKLRFEWGRWCYITNEIGGILAQWWEPEDAS